MTARLGTINRWLRHAGLLLVVTVDIAPRSPQAAPIELELVTVRAYARRVRGQA